MSKLIACALVGLFAASAAFAQARAAASDCTAKAIGKDGKPLAGAARTSFLKKCETDKNSGAGAGAGAWTGVAKQQGRVGSDSDFNEANVAPAKERQVSTVGSRKSN